MKLFKDSFYCDKCKGKCLGADQFETQKKAFQKFGIIPNNCVPDCNGRTHCPYEKRY